MACRRLLVIQDEHAHALARSSAACALGVVLGLFVLLGCAAACGNGRGGADGREAVAWLGGSAIRHPVRAMATVPHTRSAAGRSLA